MGIETVRWVGGVDGFIELIDQRQLPVEFKILRCYKVEELFDAVQTLAVRGAPAIGVAAGYGVVLGLNEKVETNSVSDGIGCVNKVCEYLKTARPTAVNLFYALDRMKKAAERFQRENEDNLLASLSETLLSEANAIYDEDVQMCRRIGENGEKLIKDNSAVLTHCNAGALATAGQGTALSIIYQAKKNGKKIHVYADESRPLLQGLRLTSWELRQEGIYVTALCDSSAGWLMKQGKIDAVIVGADRIAANGDTANKIGTYSLSVLAGVHNIPFYVAAPCSTFDLNLESGDEIPIEQRPSDEITSLGTEQLAPGGINVFNPAFDVTKARDITAIITDTGIIYKPFEKNIAKTLQGFNE
jgi:methylthioribose-1-phosphate isomerase